MCRFPELPARKPLTYQAKQLIAREIEMEKMRRAEALAWVGDSPQVSLPWALGGAVGRDSVPRVARLGQPSPHLRSAGRRGSPRGQGSARGCWGQRGTWP